MIQGDQGIGMANPHFDGFAIDDVLRFSHSGFEWQRGECDGMRLTSQHSVGCGCGEL